MSIEFKKIPFKLTVRISQLLDEQSSANDIISKSIIETVYGKDLRGALADAYNIIMAKIDKLDGTDRSIVPKRKKETVIVS